MLNQQMQSSFEILNQLDIKPVDENGVSESDIKNKEAELGIIFPYSYRSLVRKFGSIVHNDFIIFGLGVPSHLLPSIECTLKICRAIQPDFPSNLIPIHPIRNGVFACIESCEEEDSRVIQWISTFSEEEQDLLVLAEHFSGYFFQLAQHALWRQKGIDRLKKHVIDYQKAHPYQHATGGTLPHNHDWRPYRYCIQDVLFGTTVVKHSREKNILEVDVFLTADVPEYGPLAGAKALTCFLLSEAYKCGGSMEIQFTKEVEDGHIPQQVQELALNYDINFEKAQHGLITPNEAKKLYIALTGFSENFLQRLREMESNGLVNSVRACYVVHHGVWSKEQVEIIVLGSEHPDQILSGGIQPIQRHLYQHNLFHARSAMLGGFLDRNLNRRNRPEAEDVALDLEDDFRLISFEFDREYYARLVQCDEDLPIPWLVTEETEHFISAGVKFNILLRARDSVDLRRHLSEDLKQAANLRNQNNAPVFILVPYDFNDLDEPERLDWRGKFRMAHIGLLVCPESTLLLDAEAAQKLSESRILRQ